MTVGLAHRWSGELPLQSADAAAIPPASADVAQLVRALDCGSRGPPFEPGRRYHPSQHEDRAEIVHVGERRTGDDLITQPGEEAVAVEAAQCVGDRVSGRGGAGECVR